jgi:hypothetical protein
VKDGVALLFDGTAVAKTVLFIALSELLPKSPHFQHASRPK